MDRRKFVKAVGTTLAIAPVAGCISGGSGDTGGNSDRIPLQDATPTPKPDSDGDGVIDAVDDFPDESLFSVKVDEISESKSIAEDEYAYYSIPLSETTTVSIDVMVRDGPNIDALMFSESEFMEYQSGNNARFFSDASLTDTNGDRTTATLPAGDYYFVLDNTNWGYAEPPTNFDDDIAEVEVNLLGAR